MILDSLFKLQPSVFFFSPNIDILSWSFWNNKKLIGESQHSLIGKL